MNVVPKPDCSSEWIADYFDPQVAPDTLELPPDALNPSKIQMNAAALAHYVNNLSENAEGIGLFSRNSPNQNGRYIRLRHITDVNQPDAVKRFLNQFLKQISEHLSDIDDAKKSGAKSKWKAAEEAGENLTKALQALCIPTHSSLDTIRSHMNDKQEMLRENLDQFYDRIHEDLKSPLQTCYDNIQKLCDDQKLQEVVSGIDENFGQLRFSESYKDIWLCVFSKLYEKGAILQKEIESLHRIYSAGDQIRQFVREYLTHPL